jgi:hypothetical protein
MIYRCLALFLMLFATPVALEAGGKGRIFKVLPHYVDLQRRHSLSPSLYERDAYQAFLRQNPDSRSGIRFDVHWKARINQPSGLTLRLEVRGSRTDPADPIILEAPLRPGFFGRWTPLLLQGDDYAGFGELVAWRATLWNGPDRIAEERSFLW